MQMRIYVYKVYWDEAGPIRESGAERGSIRVQETWRIFAYGKSKIMADALMTEKIRGFHNVEFEFVEVLEAHGVVKWKP